MDIRLVLLLLSNGESPKMLLTPTEHFWPAHWVRQAEGTDFEYSLGSISFFLHTYHTYFLLSTTENMLCCTNAITQHVVLQLRIVGITYTRHPMHNTPMACTLTSSTQHSKECAQTLPIFFLFSTPFLGIFYSV